MSEVFEIAVVVMMSIQIFWLIALSDHLKTIKERLSVSKKEADK